MAPHFIVPFNLCLPHHVCPSMGPGSHPLDTHLVCWAFFNTSEVALLLIRPQDKQLLNMQ